MKLSELKNKQTGKILAAQHVIVYGPPKSGKTWLIGCLAAAGYHLIWIDMENGKSTLFQLPDEALDNITYIGVADTKDEPIAHSTVDKLCRGGTFNLCDTHGRVDCPLCKKAGASFTTIEIPTEFTEESAKTIVVFDSGTQLSNSVVSTVTKGKPADYQETIHDYRNAGNYLNRIFSYLQQAKFNFIITAHEIEAEREDGGIRIVPSIGTRAYAINCAKFFDHVVYMDKVNLKHKASSSTAFSNSILTGSRLNIALESMQDGPNLAAIFEGKVAAPQEAANSKASGVLAGLQSNATTKLNLNNIGGKK